MKAFAPQQQNGPFHIVTYRDIFQKVVMEYESYSTNYQARSAIVQMFPGNMKALKIKDNSNAKLRNDFGVVVVRAISYPGCQQGFGYMPVSPYSNCLASYTPGKAKLPNFKLIEVEVEPTEEAITPIADLLNLSIPKGQSDA